MAKPLTKSQKARNLFLKYAHTHKPAQVIAMIIKQCNMNPEGLGATTYYYNAKKYFRLLDEAKAKELAAASAEQDPLENFALACISKAPKLAKAKKVAKKKAAPRSRAQIAA
jgi:hypothetical protein